MTLRLAAVLPVAVILSACNATGAPTYTSAGVTIRGCPRTSVPPGHGATLSFSVVNHSHMKWPATYLLLSSSGAMRSTLKVLHAPTESIGGGITRVKSSLEPGARVTGAIVAYLAKAAVGAVNLGAWGAPGNSVAVPSTYTNPSCTLHP